MFTAEFIESMKSELGGQFSAVPSNYEKPCEFEHWDDTPISDEEFISRLPDKIIDPETGKEIFISQSKIKKVRDMAKKELCPKRFYRVTLTEQDSLEGSKAMAMGRRFEYELTGALDYDGKIPDEIPGVPGKRISHNVEEAKKTFDRMGMPLEEFGINKKYKFKCLSGSPDLEKEGEETTLVVDIKYSADIQTRNSKWNEYGWDPETLPNKFALIVQPCQYDLLGRLIYGKPVEFMFMVFHSGKDYEGEYLPIRMDISESRRNQHKNLILHVIEEIQGMFKGEGFKAIPAYKKGFCQDCPVKSCKERITHPSIVQVNI